MKHTLWHRLRGFSSVPAFAMSVVAMAMVTGCGKKQEEAPAEVVRPAKTFILGNAGEASELEFPGETQAIKVALLAFEVSGRIAELSLKEGDVVKKDDVLAQLDQTQLQADLDAATAKKKAAEATLARVAEAAKSGAVSQQQLEITNREYEVEIANLTQAQKALDDTTLKADFDGVVAKLFIERFENVVGKQDILILQDTSEIKVTVDVPESRMVLVGPDVSLEERNRQIKPMVELTALPGRRFPAVITEAAQTADANTRTYEVTAVFSPQQDETAKVRILPGMTAKVIVQVGASSGSNAFRVPSNGIGTSPEGGAFVWKLDPESMTISEVPVKLEEPGGAMIAVLGELAKGDEIVISGVRQLQTGMQVSRWQDNQNTGR
ncbi:MAG: efflux RND transporter periplasmic adaptor subunit [Luteolibacter sp.]